MESQLLSEGTALRKEGNTDRALLKFHEVLKLNPKSAIAHREMAITLQIMGEPDRAMKEYKKALAIDPSLRMRKVTETKIEEKEEEDKIATGYKARDIMATDLITVQLDQSVRDAAEIMMRKNISSVGVRDGGEIIGIVTERDFVRNHLYISGKNFASIPIKDLVAYPLVAISADVSLEEASNHMTEQGIRHLLVRDGDKIVGLISLRDILKTYAKLL